MKFISRRIALILISITAAGLVWPTAIAKSQTKSSKTYDVDIRLDETIVIPCFCKGKRVPGVGLSANWTGTTNVSVSVENAHEIPLNYDYSVTAGTVIRRGQNMVWDLARPGPGEYFIVVTVDDGVGNTGKARRKVVVAEPSCDCPCECPSVDVVSHFTEVQPGETLDFETRVAGGAIERGGPTYNWTIENGTILSGQGSPAIKVKAAGDKRVRVTATIQIGGTDPACNCPVLWSESVPIGDQTKAQTFPLKVDSPSVDEETVYIECPSGQRAAPDSPKSDDLIVGVRTGATSNSILDKLHFSYAISGGKVVGSGSKAMWDLTGLQPGTYWISADVDDGKGGARSEKKDITLVSRDCTWTPQCPRVELTDIRRVKGSNDLIVLAEVTGGGSALELNWDADGAEIIAGAGSRLVRLRPLEKFRGERRITLNLDYPGLGPGYCPDKFSLSLTPN